MRAFLRDVAAEATRARSIFPDNFQMVAALMEEVGELAQALIDHHRGTTTAEHVWEEAVQVASMALRVAEEGSGEFPHYTAQAPKVRESRT